MYETILFLDFDGTITSEETLEGSMRLCIDPLLYEEKEREMLEGRRSLADTLHLAFSLIPCNRMADIMAYVRNVPLRPGFDQLLDLAEEKGIPVVVISGGLKPVIEEKLSPYRDRLLDVHSVETRCVDGRIRLISPYEDKGDLMEKTRIMAQYSYKEAICAGDGHTDVRMALASEQVFARDTLAAILKKQGVPYEPWEDFFDVARLIKSSR
ncbi:MAG TPA: HAD-IB family phosphatase [Bacillota bacterium]|jgi:2-hydroxy-3-keto-5-methylthiopentenyl-1-phosphate phosphatase|nr:HAD-IB family phosphatase [Fastidiosipila sp.]HPX92816.1 HAD-IB family phosphatase [Bacillota bacterium]HQB81301.1 HAD-IB family phosphatase [Bacillota bacterium]